MAGYSVGLSSYPDLRGVEQFTATERIALQFISMCIDFDQMKANEGSGDRLSANEAKRPAERCYYLWNNRAALGIVVAPPLTSRHYVYGNAIDVGVTMANGQNRALTAAEFDWMHTQAERRGFTWTGVNFGEPWHIEGGTRAEILPPYPNARALRDNGPSKPGANKTPAPETSPLNGEDDMARLVTVSGSGKLNGTIALVDGLKAVVRTKDAGVAYRLGRVSGDLQPGQNTDAKIRAALTARKQNVDTNEFAEYLRAVAAAGGFVDSAYKGAF